MLDYFISLGDQESEQDNEEQNTQTADEFNFDNAYAEYLNDEDIGYDDDLDDEDEEYFGLSMWAKRLAPCFAVFRRVCGLFAEGGKVSVKTICTVFERLSRVVSDVAHSYSPLEHSLFTIHVSV